MLLRLVSFVAALAVVAACSDSSTEGDPDSGPTTLDFSIESFAAVGDGGGTLEIEFQWSLDDPDELVESCNLNPGDGSDAFEVDCGAGTATHQYDADGSYTARLTASSATASTSAPTPVEVAAATDVSAWAQQLSAETGAVHGRGVAVDAEGNAYLVGHIGVDAVVEGATASAGAEDFFVAKVDTEGNTLWVEQLGTSGDDQAWAVEVDSAGNAYVAGSTRGDLSQENAGSDDAFLLKIGPDGDEIWTVQLGSTGPDLAYGVALDEATGAVYIAGPTGGAIDGATGTGGGFVARYSDAGVLAWVTQLEAADDSTNFNQRGLAVDAAGNAYVTGFVTFGLDTNDPAGQAVLVQVSAAGALGWRTLLGADVGADQGSAVTVSGDAIFVGGATRGSYGGEYGNGWDSFVAAFDSAGAELWVKQYSGEADDRVHGLTTDAAGRVYAAGQTAALGGVKKAVATRFDPADGTEHWSVAIDSDRNCEGHDAAVTPSGALLIAGDTGANLDGESMAGGFVDAFVATAPPPAQP